MTEYLDFCEELFQNWLNHRLDLSDFAEDFELDYIPEPYFVLQPGKTPLYVLNYNPGGVLPSGEQHRTSVKTRKHGTYEEAIEELAKIYRKMPGVARNRNDKCLKFAEEMGYNGVVCVETFFLHSKERSPLDTYHFPRRYNLQQWSMFWKPEWLLHTKWK